MIPENPQTGYPESLQRCLRPPPALITVPPTGGSGVGWVNQLYTTALVPSERCHVPTLSLSVWTTTISVLVKSSDPTSWLSPSAHLRTALCHVTQAVNTLTFSYQRTQSNLQGPTGLRPGTSECLG